MSQKIVLLGGGSRYFESVIGELAITPELEDSSVVLYDVAQEGMRLIERAGRRILEERGAGLTLTSTTELPRALEGADVAISSIGVHGPGGVWHKMDSDVCARFGIIHTTGDTIGPSGLSQGLRIIPIYLEIARAMEKYCPDAVLLNHSNPMAPICRAINKYTRIRVIGYCHNIAAEIEWYGEVLGVNPDELEALIAGPNHMSWLLALHHKGRDVYPELKRRIIEAEPQPTHMFTREVLRLLDLCPIGGDRHIVEFFPHARKATRPEELEYGMPWRSDTMRERQARDADKTHDELRLRAEGTLPPLAPDTLSPEAMGEQIRAVVLGHERLHYVNAPNEGAVPNLPPWAVLDLRALVGSFGARPLYVGELPPQAARWSLHHMARWNRSSTRSSKRRKTGLPASAGAKGDAGQRSSARRRCRGL